MSALALGLLAALCWGFHDLAVRYVSQSVSVIAALMTVLVAGALLQFSLVAVWAGFAPMPAKAVSYAVVAGGFYLLAGLSMYAAFQRGPVRLVAPLVASYPVLSVTLAIWRGSEVSIWQWLAIIAIGVGVSIVSTRSDDGTEYPAGGPTIAFSILAAIGFAATFALGQYAAELGDEFTVSLIGRLTAIPVLAVIAIASRKPLWPGTRALPLLCLMGALDAVAILCVVSAGGLPNAQYASVAASIFGLLTVVLAWAILREEMAFFQWLGCIIAFVGIGYLAI
ncbi:EamA-like transporter family protein [Ruegeria denitrificans]|uniref:EamA-like transporter family protein n=1 Tax=Ruegeria denitrificans TaxID=1715692 RepID=A0A0P1IKP7_9RHOB|nr:DMT family transporter [Ruegeria denitrificans]CUK20546.1 EamA-like transporter family protein [Ruegeria denitrificans]